jgi:hypothetical protein
MLRICLIACASMALLAFGGCAATVDHHSVDQHSIARSDPANPDTGSSSSDDADRKASLHTGMPTLHAAQQIYERIEKFGFKVEYYNQPNYFFADVEATADPSRHVSVHLKWVSDDDIEISVSSNLDKPQFDCVVAAIDDAVATEKPSLAK